MKGITIRPGLSEDAASIHRIHAHAVETGTASFSLEPPSLAEIAVRVDRLLEQKLPFRVADNNGEVVGYAFADWFRPRPGYRFTLEDSIYVDASVQGRGVGRALLSAVVEDARAGGFKQIIAVIGDIGNTGSIAVHKSCGFLYAGVLKNVGFKFDRWLDTIYMQREL